MRDASSSGKCGKRIVGGLVTGRWTMVSTGAVFSIWTYPSLFGPFLSSLGTFLIFRDFLDVSGDFPDHESKKLCAFERFSSLPSIPATQKRKLYFYCQLAVSEFRSAQ